MNPVSDLERVVMERLAALGYARGVDYVYQARIGGVAGEVDFFFPLKVPAFFEDDGRPLRGMVLEVDGCHWHRCFACGYVDFLGIHKQDERKTARLEAAGYRVVRLWGHEVLGDPKRLDLILFCLSEQKWGTLGRALDELDRALEAAMERTLPLRVERALREAEADCAAKGKPVPAAFLASCESELAEWLLRHPEGDLRRRARRNARAALGFYAAAAVGVRPGPGPFARSATPPPV